MKRLYVLLCVLPFVLSAQQQLNSIPNPFSAGSGGCWDFDGNTLDHSGNNNHGMATNVVYVRNRFNQPNSAAYFNGVNSKVVVPHSSTVDFTTGVSFSFTYWQKAYPGNVDKVIITKHTYGNWDGYNFIANNQANSGYCTSTNHMYWYTAAGALEDACSDAALLSDTAWHFIAGLYDASNNKSYLYIDGVQQGDVGRASGGISTNANLSFGFDADINDLFFHGVLDDACLYPRLLTTAEIQNMYSSVSGIGGVEGITAPSVYPNPSNGSFCLQFGKNHPFNSGEIFDQLGRCVMKFQITGERTTVDTDLPAGIYFIAVSSSSGLSVKEKMVIGR
jgi:hypothetical protein